MFQGFFFLFFSSFSYSPCLIFLHGPVASYTEAYLYIGFLTDIFFPSFSFLCSCTLPGRVAEVWAVAVPSCQMDHSVPIEHVQIDDTFPSLILILAQSVQVQSPIFMLSSCASLLTRLLLFY